jgi:hypothetical protein
MYLINICVIKHWIELALNRVERRAYVMTVMIIQILTGYEKVKWGLFQISPVFVLTLSEYR